MSFFPLGSFLLMAFFLTGVGEGDREELELDDDDDDEDDPLLPLLEED